MQLAPGSFTVIALVFAATASCAQDTAGVSAEGSDIPFLLDYPNLDDADGDVLLDNEHVVVQRFVVPPDTWEGVHAHPGDQVYVHVVGGTWSGRAGGESTYTDSISETGSVGYMPRIPLSEGHESGNTGDMPIDLIWVTLKADGPIRPDIDVEPFHYPEIPMDLLLENERVIVQRVQVEPGQHVLLRHHGQALLHVLLVDAIPDRAGKLIEAGQTALVQTFAQRFTQR